MVVDIALACIMLAQVFGVYRILRGPSWGDRIAALDFVSVSLAVMIVLLALRTGFTVLLDAALIVSILGFLSTVALTRYRLSRRLMK